MIEKQKQPEDYHLKLWRRIRRYIYLHPEGSSATKIGEDLGISSMLARKMCNTYIKPRGDIKKEKISPKPELWFPTERLLNNLHKQESYYLEEDKKRYGSKS